ncbi:MAG: hypothetical protein JRI96_05380 [Deltaproteobacteria bacterium]|nr:hypothetical protein [Deltaproteobacteria bacterium]
MSFSNAISFFNYALLKINNLEGEIGTDEAEFRRNLCSGLMSLMKGLAGLEKKLETIEEKIK